MENTNIEFPKLPKKFKAKWVAALRSGKYKQGKGFLLDENGKYCCLGVACSIQRNPKKLLVGKQLIDDDAIKGIPTPLFGDNVHTNKLLSELTAMNDGYDEYRGKRKTFKQIATWIEKYL